MSIALPIAFFSPTNSNPPVFVGDIIYSIQVAGSASNYPNSNFIFGKFSSINSVSLSGFGLLNSNGDVDNNFKPYLSNPFDSVYSSAVSAGTGNDFKFIVGLGGGGVELRPNTSTLAVINLSSSGGYFSDNTFFNTNQPNNAPFTIYVGNRIYLGGLFTQIGLTSRKYFAAFELNGTLSTLRFNANSYINVIKPNVSSTDLFMGGAFTTVTRYNVSPAVTSTRRGLIKVTSAGGITTFNANGIFTNTILVNAIEVMSDGRVIVGSVNNTITAKNLVILAANTISTTTTYQQFENLLGGIKISTCYSLKIDNNGKLLACIAIFDASLNPLPYQTRLYRFNITPTISVDTSFGGGDGYLPIGDFTASLTTTNIIESINVDSNNRIVLGGTFSVIDNISRNLYAVLDNDGAIIS